jgi:ABC-type multidrug transport system fused ATPase/permease subunit
MNLRSAVVTSVYNKALVISAASLHTQSTGQITNLMSVDATRLQELTPYLHAIWYSLYQIVIAMYFLWRQMGPSCLAGCAVIIGTIPLTGKITQSMKSLQKQMSSVRDERIKVSNEVLSGMKVIKLQAWENEYKKRIEDIRERELSTFRKYVISQALAGALYTTIPLAVGICTFTAYIASGHTLTVATALTSLALFEILRFPLFMLPMVLNNIVEARVSVDRIQTFLLEPEKHLVPSKPLQQTGVLLDKATLVWERTKCAAANKAPGASAATGLSRIQRLKAAVAGLWDRVRGNSQTTPSTPNAESAVSKPANTPFTKNPLWTEVADSQTGGITYKKKQPTYTQQQISAMSNEEYLEAVMHAQLWEAETHIEDLEKRLREGRLDGRSPARLQGSDLGVSNNAQGQTMKVELSFGSQEKDLEAGATAGNGSNSVVSADQLLTLSRINFRAGPGDLVAVVGQVGSGKSSLLSAVLGDMKLCFGSVSRRGRVAYVGQRPFIQNSTLRDNITFGQRQDEDKYQETLKRCALLPDLSVLPAGDMTEIGERGINLSGGQKARVAIARAVYFDAELYLLDDPLAAVDAHVGQHLFTQCIQPLVQSSVLTTDQRSAKKCVILVTNALQYVKYCTSIVVVKQGRIVECGSFEELMRMNAHFSEMMAAFQDTKDDVNNANQANSASVVAPNGVVNGSEDLLTVELSNDDQTHTDDVAVATTNNDKMVEVSLTDHSDQRRRTLSDVSRSTGGKGGTSKEIEMTAKNSPTPLSPGAAKAATSSGQLIVTEDREVGNVSTAVYMQWATAAGGVTMGITMLAFYFSGEFVSVCASWWLSYWSAHKELHSAWFYLGIYVLINLFVVVFMLIRDLFGRLISLHACKILFSDMLLCVLYAPMSFFDTTPLGRIINRFSKDIYTIDEQLPQTIRGYLGSLCKVIGVLLYICVITPFFIVCLVPIIVFYSVSQKYYIRTSRELTRLDSMSRSPIFALFR